ncbi:MAG: hypothetical protein U0X40_07105 [Ferruginibacter sp.]
MDQLLVSYLIQNKYCSLGELGCLRFVQHPARPDFGSKLIQAPAEEIVHESNPDQDPQFITYLAAQLGCPETDALQRWTDFLHSLQKESEAGRGVINGLGSFSKDHSGNWQFVAENLTAAFFPSVSAHRVIHPEAAHSMLVGDKETTTVQMAEYLNEEETAKDRWWIAALVLAAVAIVFILLYFINNKDTHTLGNAVPYDYFD